MDHGTKCSHCQFEEIAEYDGTEYGETLKAMGRMVHASSYMSEEFQKALDTEMRNEYWRILQYARITKVERQYTRISYCFEWGEYE